VTSLPGGRSGSRAGRRPLAFQAAGGAPLRGLRNHRAPRGRRPGRRGGRRQPRDAGQASRSITSRRTTRGELVIEQRQAHGCQGRLAFEHLRPATTASACARPSRQLHGRGRRGRADGPLTRRSEGGGTGEAGRASPSSSESAISPRRSRARIARRQGDGGRTAAANASCASSRRARTPIRAFGGNGRGHPLRRARRVMTFDGVGGVPRRSPASFARVARDATRACAGSPKRVDLPIAIIGGASRARKEALAGVRVKAERAPEPGRR
jgi:hypothetical protein